MRVPISHGLTARRMPAARPQQTGLIGCPAKRSGNMPHAPERQLSSTGAMTTLPLLSTPGSMPTPAAKKWKVFFATMARHIRWARSRRTHSAFTTWQGTFGSGPRTVTTTATPAFPPTGARTRPLRTTPRPTTARASASAWIAAARGCFRRGCCGRPPENAILPTTAMTSWVSASLERSRKANEVTQMRKLRIVATLVFSVSIAALAQEAAPQSQSSPAPRVIDLKSADGTVLKGTYFAAPKPGPGAILYHQSNRTRQSWAALAAQLAAAGIHVLTVDKRGFGDSGGKSDSKEART